jgi:hypothetical protein
LIGSPSNNFNEDSTQKILIALEMVLLGSLVFNGALQQQKIPDSFSNPIFHLTTERAGRRERERGMG